jgi:hypothetical protein
MADLFVKGLLSVLTKIESSSATNGFFYGNTNGWLFAIVLEIKHSKFPKPFLLVVLTYVDRCK